MASTANRDDSPIPVPAPYPHRADAGASGLSQLILLVAVVLDIILAFDFVFHAMRAAATGFASWIYTVAGFIEQPFDGIFRPTLTSQGYVLRWGDVLAVIVITLAGAILIRIAQIGSRRLATP